MLLVTAENFFDILIKSSFTAGIAAAVVFAARAAARKAPKRWAYMMWAVVFFRCLCPFSMESGLSVFNIFHTYTSDSAVYDMMSEEYGASAESLETGGIPAAVTRNIRSISETSYYRDGIDVQPIILDSESGGSTAEPKPADGINTSTIFIIVWLCGSSSMAIYGVISAFCLAARVKTAVRTEEGVYESDRIATAFTAGILRTKIYIPCGIPENERRLIVMHERVHIRRRDYLFKILAFAGLSLHWFNPLIWAAFALMTRDMEMSCDEAVLKKCGSCDRILYAEALLRVSVKGFGPAAVVGFGETGIKERVKNVLNYKTKSRLAAALAAALMLASCAATGTDAVDGEYEDTSADSVSSNVSAADKADTDNAGSENTDMLRLREEEIRRLQQQEESKLRGVEERLKKEEAELRQLTENAANSANAEYPAIETLELNDETYYLIFDEEQLRAISAGKYGMDKNYMQQSDIQLSSDEWIPIGTKENPFTGSYNGNGFEISGLTMKDPDTVRVGMFGYTEQANIYNITLRDYDIESAGRNAPQYSCAPILPVVSGGTRCYDNRAYPAGSSGSVKTLVKPCPQDAEITEAYGTDGVDGMHKGIDYGVNEGTEIYAAADGKIISCDDKLNGYGTCIIIDHGNDLITVYAHLSKSLVSPEDDVSAGYLIGYSGSTGYAFGNHLHFEVRQDGQHTDPLPYLKN